METPQHFLLHGERGIGKSSLSMIHEWSAAGAISGWHDHKYNFLTFSVILEPADTYESIIRKLGTSLKRRLGSHEKLQTKAKEAWDFLKHWEIMGVKYRAAEAVITPSELLDELVDSYVKASERIADTFDGIMIVVDEADKPSVEANLGALIKGFTERLTRASANTICIGLAGVSSVLSTLSESHESALRLFKTFHLKLLTQDESITVIRRGISVSNEKSEEKTSITEEAENFISLYSEGYPHFIQQFAYCAFEADTDGAIDKEDVITGAWGEHGAFDQLGTKYFQGLYFDRIGSDDYRQVLRFMAQHLDDWVTKDQIRQHTKLKSSTLDNAIKALGDRQIIIREPGKRGSYRLPMKSFAAWIRAYTSFPDNDPGSNSSTQEE